MIGLNKVVLSCPAKMTLNLVLSSPVHVDRATKRIFGPQGKRKLGPPPPTLQIMILKLSPPRCVISQESVQQKELMNCDLGTHGTGHYLFPGRGAATCKFGVSKHN